MGKRGKLHFVYSVDNVPPKRRQHRDFIDFEYEVDTLLLEIF
jgi:hypothetical protein